MARITATTPDITDQAKYDLVDEAMAATHPAWSEVRTAGGTVNQAASRVFNEYLRNVVREYAGRKAAAAASADPGF